MTLSRRRRSFSLGNLVSKLFLLIIIGLAATAFFLFFETSKPVINVSNISQYIGKIQPLEIDVTDTGSGLRQVTVNATQGANTKELYNVTNPRVGYTGQIGPLSDHQTVTFDAAKLGFTEGPVSITVTARDYSMMGFFRGNMAAVTVNATLDTKPPVIKILHSEQYISPGGAGIVVYSVDDSNSSHGVIINGRFNPGHPLGGDHIGSYIAYFALPYDAETLTESLVRATDIAGNSAMLSFSTHFKMVQQKHDRINITDGFLTTKIPEFEQHYPEMTGNLVEKYVYSNSIVRDKNNAIIEKVCSKSDDERYWQGRFTRMPGSNRAGFADHRTYYYNDQPIDKQVHLGMDIASTQQANVTAANRGKIVYADYLGIYGNMVMIDHGQGLFSLYSHLSQIDAKVGEMVNGGDTIGLTGTTGMAGGDHLHFSMLVNGVFTTPIEWWDSHWIEVTIDRPLAALKTK